MHLDGFGSANVPGPESTCNLGPLAVHLAQRYPADHLAAIVTLDSAGMRLTNVALNQLSSATVEVRAGSHLFLDLMRAVPSSTGIPA